MKHKTLLVMLLVLALFVTACSNDGNQPAHRFDPFVGGTQGILFEFIEGMPPTQEGAILDAGKTAFSVGAKLTNVGEHTIEEGDFLQLQLRGLLPEQFDITENDMIIFLEGPLPGARKNIDGTILPGQFTTLSFDNLRYLPDTRGDLPKTFQVELCYDYSTMSTTPICVAGDTTSAITDPNSQDICQITGSKQTKNSGGPVHIVDFKQMPQGDDKISIVFTVSQMDVRGKLFASGSDNGCDLSLTNTDKNKVGIKLSLPTESAAQITCPGITTGFASIAEGEIILYEGNPRTVTCTVKGNAQPGVVYEDLISIDLFYRYGQMDQKTIVIKDLGTSSS
jgi:hypothetical protein